MAVPDVVFPAGLEQAVGALDVGAQEGLGVRDGAVVVGLRGEADNRVVARNDPVEQLGVAGVANHKLHAVLRKARDVGRVARVGELVEHRHVHARALPHHVVHEVGPDEAAAAGYDDVIGLEDLGHWVPFFCIQGHGIGICEAWRRAKPGPPLKRVTIYIVRSSLKLHAFAIHTAAPDGNRTGHSALHKHS